MKLNNQKGFSLIELLVVLVIIGILAGITFPYLIKTKNRAENGNAYASLRTFFSLQITYYTANGRYARLNELNVDNRNSLGTINAGKLIRGPFTFEMNPLNPSDEDLKSDFTIFVRKPGATGVDAYSLSIDTTGRIIENPPE